MALVKCPECSKEISDRAVVCTQCGFPMQQWKKKNEEVYATSRISKRTLKLVFAISIIVFAIFFLLVVSSAWLLDISRFFDWKVGIGIIVYPLYYYYGSSAVRLLEIVSVVVTLASMVSTIVFASLFFGKSKK